jgi:hypothetical protein
MTNHELQSADLARVRAELAHALAANRAEAALESLIARIDARLAELAPQPTAATRELYRSSPAPMRMSHIPAPTARIPRGFFAG